MLFCLLVLVLVLLSFLFQEFVPTFNWLYMARPLIVHTVFFAAAVSVPFPVMLIIAFIAGLIWDSRHYIPIETATSQPEIPFGFIILIFGLLGTFIQGVRPFFRQGRWLLPWLMIGICTFAGMLLEYLIISFQRGEFQAPPEFWLKLLWTSFFSALLAPFLLLLISQLAGWTGFKIQMEGITRRYSFNNSNADSV